MQRLGLLSCGAVAALVLSACVGDAPAPVQGVVDGPCYADDTCNPGLQCTMVAGRAKCVIAGDASVSDSGTIDAAGDAGPRVCQFAPTKFPCGGQDPPVACFGQSTNCTLTGCADVWWECNSPNQCSGTPCCVPAGSALLVPSANCTQGTLQMASDDAGVVNVNGASCKQGLACPAGETQLCQANSQCPTGKICSPVKVTGGPASMNGYTVGACIPE